MPYLLLLFNNIFKSSHFPQAWSVGSIVPLFKKGNINDADNYRGITLVSCFGKLFTSVLNNRLVTFDETFNVINDAQFWVQKTDINY